NDGRAPVAHEQQDYERGQNATQDQVQLYFVKSRLDVARLVLHDIDGHAGRQDLTDPLEPGFDAVDHLDRIRSGLPLYQERHCRLTIVAGRGTLLLVAVLGVTDVADAHGGGADRGHDEVVELSGIGEAAHGAQHQLTAAFVHAPSRDVGVL